MNTAPEQGETFYRISSGVWTAGVCFLNGRAKFCAPVIGWAMGKTESEVLGYFRRKGHKVEQIEDKTEAGSEVQDPS